MDFEEESALEHEYPSSGFSANWLSSRRFLRVVSSCEKTSLGAFATTLVFINFIVFYNALSDISCVIKQLMHLHFLEY